MDFLRLFLRGLALAPSLIQGVEGLDEAKTGDQKRQAAVELVGSAINVAAAVSSHQIADGPGFTAGLGTIVDGVVACLNASVWHQA